MHLVQRVLKMTDQEWIKKLEDGRKVKFIHQEPPEDAAFSTAQIAANGVVYSVVLSNPRNLLSHEDIESHFNDGLSNRLDQYLRCREPAGSI